MLSKHSVGIYQGNELTCNSSGNTRPKSSQLADPGLKSETGVRKLVSTLKKKKKRTRRMKRQTSLRNHRKRGKATNTTSSERQQFPLPCLFPFTLRDNNFLYQFPCRFSTGALGLILFQITTINSEADVLAYNVYTSVHMSGLF